MLLNLLCSNEDPLVDTAAYSAEENSGGADSKSQTCIAVALE